MIGRRRGERRNDREKERRERRKRGGRERGRRNEKEGVRERGKGERNLHSPNSLGVPWLFPYPRYSSKNMLNPQCRYSA